MFTGAFVVVVVIVVAYVGYFGMHVPLAFKSEYLKTERKTSELT